MHADPGDEFIKRRRDDVGVIEHDMQTTLVVEDAHAVKAEECRAIRGSSDLKLRGLANTFLEVYIN
ncbi:MAG: hypothetical protein WC250_03080 [Candidatus Paceibacterota bacterium]